MNPFKRFVIVSMFFAFLCSAITGIIKLPEMKKFFLFVYDYAPASTISIIHDWSGIVLILLIIIHLILKREALSVAFFGGYQIPQKISRVIYVLIGVALALLATTYINKSYFKSGDPIKLSAVEVKEYKGERLDSINDFRENSIAGPQYINKETYKLEVAGLVEKPIDYSYNEILNLQPYQKVVQLNCVEGWSAKILWEGVLVRDLLKDLAIKPEAKTIILYAQDGYSTSFPIDYIMHNDIIMAYKMNDVEIPPERGFPFQLVAEQKWGYKWIKWITKIELSDDVNYKGFWESRGYSNTGNLDEPKFESI